MMHEQSLDIFDGVETWVFDLDNTLYPASSKLFDQVSRRMTGYIAEYFNMAPDAALARQKDFFMRYGTTLRGLMTEHGVDPEPFLDYVHKIDVGAVAPNPSLALKLGKLPGRKLVFTNSSRVHARRVMERIGINGHFEEVFDIADADYVPKPDRTSYAMMLRRHKVSAATACMVEDLVINLEPAKALGMATVWLRHDTERNKTHHSSPIPRYIDFVTDDLCDWLDLVLARRGAADESTGASCD
jgi:putative hydrolase of the HAD superfamily